MTGRPNILLFGDQTETNLSIQALCDGAKTSERLRRYVQAAYDAVSHAVQEAVSPQARHSYYFVSWSELEKTIASQEVPDVVLRTTALCFAQLGHLIRLLETDTQVYKAWKAQTLIITASCAGQIPAALAASTQSLDKLVLAAPEVVAVAFRTGLDVDLRTNSFNDDRSKSWATAVGTDLESVRSIVDDFNRRKGLPPSGEIYVGVTSKWATTVIGPPKLLEELFVSRPFPADVKITPLPINATFHAFKAPKPDMKWIVGATPVLDSLALTNSVFLSSEDGVAFPPQSGIELVGEAVLNMLSRMTDNIKVFAKVSELLMHSTGYIVPVVADKVSSRMILALKGKEIYLHTHGLN